MSDDMSNKPLSAEKRRRVNRMKKLIVITIGVLTILPLTISIILLIQFQKLKIDVSILAKSVEKQNDVEQKSYEEPIAKEDYVTTDTEVPLQENSSELSIDLNTDAPEKPGETEAAVLENENLRRIYLTFDDGPSIYTDDILDILAEYGVKATFFVLEKDSDIYTDLYKRIIDEGHSLGMHSASHVYEDIYKDMDSFSADISKIQEFIFEKTGYECYLYRFPGGSSNSYCTDCIQEYLSYLQQENITYFDWNVSSQDAAGVILKKDEIVNNVINGVLKHEDSVVLMHDAQSKKTTVDALPDIIERILAMEDTVILPITEETNLIQHRKIINH